MSKFISREKEFRKINEQLNKMTTQTLETAMEQAAKSSRKSESKYLTYTKGKGPSSLLLTKSIAASEDLNTPTETLRDTSNTSTARDIQTNRKAMRVRADCELGAITERRRAIGSNPRSTAVGRMIAKTSSTVSRISTVPKKTDTATILIAMYKNQKFSESPSLQSIAVHEHNSLYSKALIPVSSTPTDVDSYASISPTASKQSVALSVSSHTENLPKKNLSSNGLIKYLKSKFAILKEDHEKLLLEMSKQKALVEKSLERQKKIESQRDQAFIKNNSLSEQLTKIGAQLEEAMRRLKERDTEQNSCQKELEAVRRELKVLSQANNNLEKRLYRANEDLENSKNTQDVMRKTEREIRESSRLDNETRDKQIKSLKKQRADLMNAYKKQLFLIDNLKRQNICMEQSRMITFGEKEFTKVLEWSSKN